MFPLLLHPSLTLESQSVLRRLSLENGKIHHAFHYLSARQSALWMNLHRAYSPATEGGPADSIYREAARVTAETITDREVQVLALGSGGSWKDVALVKALRDAGKKVRFVAVDASPFLAVHSAEQAKNFGVESSFPIAADLLSCAEALKSQFDDLPNLVTAYGLLPNFEPDEFFSFLRAMLRPQDRLLVSANLLPEDRPAPEAMELILPQYDNPPMQSWVCGVLQDWGIESQLENYRMVPREANGHWRFEGGMTWKQDAMLDWEGSPLSIQAGKYLRLFFSCRYTAAQVRSLTQDSNLPVVTEWISDHEDEGIFCLKNHAVTAESHYSPRPSLIKLTLELMTLGRWDRFQISFDPKKKLESKGYR